jgi:hypothetical protein
MAGYGNMRAQWQLSQHGLAYTKHEQFHRHFKVHQNKFGQLPTLAVTMVQGWAMTAD